MSNLSKNKNLTGARLRAGRHATDRTEKALGEELGVGESAVAHWEAGRRTPSLKLAQRIEILSASWPQGPIKCTEWGG
jgi:transcriptional regulator with XRE-family HTH domain